MVVRRILINKDSVKKFALNKLKMSNDQVRIGVIGGSGLYNMEGFELVKEINPETPWGFPSAPITISKSPEGHQIAFLSRHGKGHTLNPSEIPARANIAALKSLGVEVILAFSAVGSLREEIAPKHFVLPSQIIDRTKGFRENTFFEKGIVAHAGFADPFHEKLRELIFETSKTLEGAVFHKDKTLVCMEGPAFSTRAESHMYRSWGCDIINMSVVPEAKLAREAEIAYQMICMSTDYDCWRVSEEAVTVQAVMETMSHNALTAKNILNAVLPNLEKKLDEDTEFASDVKGSMQFSIVSNKSISPKSAIDRVSYLFPQYFSQN